MEVPDDDAGLDAWIAGIEAYLRELDPHPQFDWPEMWPYTWSVRQAIVALQRARQHKPPSLRFELIIGLAQAVAEARRAEGELLATGLYKQLDAKEEILREIERALVGTEDANEARLTGLARAREKLTRERDELTQKIETLRPEFEAKLRCGMSASRAAQILGERHELNPETLRKRLRKRP